MSLYELANKRVITSIASVYLFASLFSSTARADDCIPSVNSTAEQGLNCVGQDTGITLRTLGGSEGVITLIINSLFGIAAILSVIFIVIGAFKIVFSNGNEKTIQDARTTILFAIIGLVVCILAFAILNFVLNELR